MHDQVERGEEFEYLAADGRGTRDRDQRPVEADGGPQLGEDEPVGDAVLQFEQRREWFALVAQAAGLGANPAGPEGDGPLGAGRLAQPLADGGEHLLPDAGHTEEDKGPHLFEVVGHLVDRLGKVDCVADGRRPMHREHLLGDVRQRQVGEGAALGVNAGHLLRHPRRPGQVAVGEHDPLRRPCGAGGVDERGHVLLAEPLDRGRHSLVGGACGEGEEALPRHRHGVVGRRNAPHEHHMLELRHLLARCHHLGPLREVFDQQELRAAVVDHVGQLVGRTGGVDAGGCAAHAHAGHVEDGPLGTVEADDGHAARALREAEREEGAGCLLHLCRVVCPARLPPLAAHLLGIGRGVRTEAGLFKEAAGDGVRHERSEAPREVLLRYRLPVWRVNDKRRPRCHRETLW